MMEFLQQERVLMVQGTGFNWDAPDHFRVVFYQICRPCDAMDRLERFLTGKRKEFGTGEFISEGIDMNDEIILQNFDMATAKIIKHPMIEKL